MRAKFIVNTEMRSNYGTITYKLYPVTGQTTENDEFFKTTPAGEISVTVKPDATSARLELGSVYYIDFIKADE